MRLIVMLYCGFEFKFDFAGVESLTEWSLIGIRSSILDFSAVFQELGAIVWMKESYAVDGCVWFCR